MKRFLIICHVLILPAFAFAADMTGTCQQYVKDVDALIIQATEMGAEKKEIDDLRAQSSEATEQISELPEWMQNSVCQHVLNKMNEMKNSMNIK